MENTNDFLSNNALGPCFNSPSTKAFELILDIS